MKKTVRKAIIPAAGLGTRFLPATKSQSKEMLPIVDKQTLHNRRSYRLWNRRNTNSYRT